MRRPECTRDYTDSMTERMDGVYEDARSGWKPRLIFHNSISTGGAGRLEILGHAGSTPAAI